VPRARTVICLLAIAACAAPAFATAAPADANPCLVPEQAAQLRCPDLVMRRPFALYADGFTRRHRVLLRAGNSIDNIGLGPAELFGVRTRGPFMRARQRIYKLGGGRIGVRTRARLYFKLAHEHRRWWKFLHAAEFQLWRVNHQGERTRLVRRGPKVAYCLRDLKHSRPGRKGSPEYQHYGACSTNFFQRKVTLGTSVGYSDVYPSTYPEQWIDVSHLRGCFAYAMVADPRNGIFESNEQNNLAQVIVRLPFRAGHRRRGCPGRGIGAGPPHDFGEHY
jgi:hypothetical protein